MAVTGALCAAAALLAVVRGVWYRLTRDATKTAIEQAPQITDHARAGVLRTQDLLNWGWFAVAVLLVVLAVLVGLASFGTWLLFGVSALVCVPLGVAGWRFPAAEGLDAVALAFIGCVVVASAVALLWRRPV
ncbi:hypothetical protein [Streptomyces natalensis]|uniref:Integral membrane protein n=1 Tax=Streptomyces natalensis ATCC 27448 TaxID=1240678 RepID=A0A0D7CQH3_9ACTN|nr:hypothetical protein [Streptomyces natalensis]KIZ18463.1 hypothetical protein SNA_07575 [Streptomyces natalensis ATCC 27448]